MLDLGAGSGDTTAAILQAAPHWGKRGVFHLVDPAKASLHEANMKLQEAGLVGGSRLRTYAVKDLEAFKILQPESVDVVVANASLHHHALMAPVFTGVGSVLRHGGWLVIGDWHCTMWLKPARVLKLLDKIEWAGKEDQLAQLRQRFPEEVEPEEEHLPELEAANRQIQRFWVNYARVKGRANPSYLLLEGHRPAGEYVSGLAAVGIHVRRGPIHLLRGSALLSVLVAQKK